VAGSKPVTAQWRYVKLGALARSKNISASYLCSSASAFLLYVRASAASHPRLSGGAAAGLNRGGQQASDCPRAVRSLAPLQDPKTLSASYLCSSASSASRVICVYPRFTLSASICGFRSHCRWIVAGSKPVTAPPCRAKLGAFARSKNVSASYLCSSASSASRVICVYPRSTLSASICGFRSRCRWIVAGSKPGDCACASCEAWRLCKIQKTPSASYLCSSASSASPRYPRYICDPLYLRPSAAKPVTAPRPRAKLGAFARSKNAICVLSVLIGVICVPALSAYICGPLI
jgi:hypothetical protein